MASASYGLISLAMALALPMGGGNDLLDFAPTEVYWKTKGVYVTVDAMVNELQLEKPQDISAWIGQLGHDEFRVRQAASRKILDQGPSIAGQLDKATGSDDEEIADRARQLLRQMGQGKKATAERRLMAIRALGELRSRQAIEPLKKMLGSEETFVDEYARRAIAKIEGKPLRRVVPTAKQLDEDLWLLPKGCAAVGQMMFRQHIPFDIEQSLKKLGTLPAFGRRVDSKTYRTNFYNRLFALTQSVGNIRLDSLTLGISGDFGPQTAYVVAIIRGKYDRSAVKAELAEMGATITVKDGVDMVAIDRQAMLLLPSDDRFIYVTGAAAARAVVIDQMIAATKAGKGQLAENQELAKLIKSVDRESAIWLVANMTETYKKAPLFKPLSSIILEAQQNEGAIDAIVTATIGDAEGVTLALRMFDSGLKKAIESGEQQAKRMPMFQSMIDLLKTVKREKSDSHVTVTAQIADVPAVMMTPMMMRYWIRF